MNNILLPQVFVKRLNKSYGFIVQQTLSFTLKL